MQEHEPIVITGAGAICALGTHPEQIQDALFAGDYGIHPSQHLEEAGVRHFLGGYVDALPRIDFLPEPLLPFLSPLSQVALFCAGQAWKSSRMRAGDYAPEKMGVLLGSGLLNVHDLEPAFRRYFGEQRKRLSPTLIPFNMASSPSSLISLGMDLRGTCHTFSGACAAGASAIVEAVHLLRSGRQDAVLCGGMELLQRETIVRGWEAMRVLSPEIQDPQKACTPFDADRKGLVLGDGGAVFMMERQKAAEKRGAPILARVEGVFQNADAGDMVKPSVEGMLRCMQGALGDAHLSPGEIHTVQAHGTATRLNDATEAAGMSALFEERQARIPVSAIKGQIGHTLGASGPLAALAALATLRDGRLYPIPNFTQANPGPGPCILTHGEREATTRRVMVNTFAFGGINVCMVLGKTHSEGGK